MNKKTKDESLGIKTVNKSRKKERKRERKKERKGERKDESFWLSLIVNFNAVKRARSFTLTMCDAIFFRRVKRVIFFPSSKMELSKEKKEKENLSWLIIG